MNLDFFNNINQYTIYPSDYIGIDGQADIDLSEIMDKKGRMYQILDYEEEYFTNKILMN